MKRQEDEKKCEKDSKDMSWPWERKKMQHDCLCSQSHNQSLGLTEDSDILEICVSILGIIPAAWNQASSTFYFHLQLHTETTCQSRTTKSVLSLESHNSYSTQKENVSKTYVLGICPKINYHRKGQIHTHTQMLIITFISKMQCTIDIV